MEKLLARVNSNVSDRNLMHLYPAFRAKVEAILTEMNRWYSVHMPGCIAVVVEGFRTAEYQRGLYAIGRTKPGRIVTYKDGYQKKSNHQSGLAVDIECKRGGEIVWEPGEAARDYYAHLAREHGLQAGRDWKGFRDDPHIEWRAEDTATYKAARKWLKEQGLA